MVFIELKGQGKTLQGFLVKGQITSNGGFDFPKVIK
jgi:hypothetical protein